MPPLHPRCRCAIMYREIKGKDKKPRTDALDAPPPSFSTPAPSTAPKIISLPNATGACKTFDELKLYWADNYNVRVAPEISKLDFESVRAAMSGVEAVLNEFPQAGFFLQEFSVLTEGIMCTRKSHGIIYFNPKYFNDARKLLTVLSNGVKNGYYHKNINPVSVGAHEMAHIIEKWLNEKHGGNLQDLKDRIWTERVIVAAYGESLRELGEFKTLNQLRKEICKHSFEENFSECLSDAVSDYITNNKLAALLSQKILEELKKELSKMKSFSESKLALFSVEEFEKYSIFDERGLAIGVKDNAPAEFKAAFEADKKLREKWEELGID